MRRRFVFALTAALVLGIGGPGWAQSSDDRDGSRSQGGLHVSGGGVFGYIGGSGSPSGTIRGPGGSGSSAASDRGRDVAPAAPAAEPTAVQGGVVADVPLEAEPAPDAEQASSGARVTPLTWVIVALMFAGFVWLYRRLPTGA